MKSTAGSTTKVLKRRKVMKMSRRKSFILMSAIVLVIVGAVLVGFACTPAGTMPPSCQQWYNQGKMDGYNDGYAKGKADGQTVGYSDGYTKGLQEGKVPHLSYLSSAAVPVLLSLPALLLLRVLRPVPGVTGRAMKFNNIPLIPMARLILCPD
jgi:hypothetical protein